MTLAYRKNVAVFIINHENKILTCRRADEHSDWQLPQGGVDPGEALIECLKRELAEEVSLFEFEILHELPQSFHYDWPESLHIRGFKGQEQHFFLVRPADINWKPNFENHHQIEFNESSWLTLKEFVEIIKNTFRAKSYIPALEELRTLAPELFNCEKEECLEESNQLS